MNRLLQVGLVLLVTGAVLGGCVLAVSAIVAPTYREGNQAIAPGTDFEVTFAQNSNGPFDEVVFRVAVKAGPPVDVYVLQDADYARYRTGQPITSSVDNFVYENVTQVDESPYPSVGLWHVVIDNTDYGAARPRGATAQVNYILPPGGGLPSSIALGGIAAASLILFLGLMMTTMGYRDHLNSAAPAGRERRGRP